MEKIETAVSGAYILEPKVFGDHRGYFMETYSQRIFEVLGLVSSFVWPRAKWRVYPVEQ